MPSLPSTSRAGSRTTSPPTVTRPSKTICSEARREATPEWARNLARRMNVPATINARRTPPEAGGGAAMDLELLDTTLTAAGEPAFRARQVWRWTANGARGYDEMTDLPAALRERLADEVPFSSLALAHEAHSSDGTVKALFHTHDGRAVEAVMMRYRDGRRSICVSSQSGCPLTCSFCATGAMKFGRNLTASEILDQVLHFRHI